MKRPAICLFVWVALVGWAATGHAKKGGGKAAAPAADDRAKTAAGIRSGGRGGQRRRSQGRRDRCGERSGAAASESLDTTETKVPARQGRRGYRGPPRPPARASTLSWKDIVVVPRKPFLKGGRLELSPFTGISVNDNLIRHYVFGVDLNYFLTDVLWIGLQGQYFIKQLTDQEELIGLQYNRTPTLNQYLYGGSLNFGYVPVYGKFASSTASIMHWEIWASAGVGADRHPDRSRATRPTATVLQEQRSDAQRRHRQPLLPLDWLTVNFALRDYIVARQVRADPNRAAAGNRSPRSAQAQARPTRRWSTTSCSTPASGIYLPTKFQYKTPR